MMPLRHNKRPRRKGRAVAFCGWDRSEQFFAVSKTPHRGVFDGQPVRHPGGYRVARRWSSTRITSTAATAVRMISGIM